MDELLPFVLDDELYRIAWEIEPKHKALVGADLYLRAKEYNCKWKNWKVSQPVKKKSGNVSPKRALNSQAKTAPTPEKIALTVSQKSDSSPL